MELLVVQGQVEGKHKKVPIGYQSYNRNLHRPERHIARVSLANKNATSSTKTTLSRANDEDEMSSCGLQ